ncbi:MAG: Rv2993c-like domain-containing protein, partial [Anaerolineales bacterium]
MRFITYQTESGPRLGAVQGEQVQPMAGMDMLALIEAGPAGLDQAHATQGEPMRLADLTLLAPIPTPRRNILCVGLNYLEHAKEGAAARGVPFVAPEIPVFFSKATMAMN